MTEDLLKKYDGLLLEFDLTNEFDKGEHSGLAAFLARKDITIDRLAEMVLVYWQGMNHYLPEGEVVKNTINYRSVD